MAARTTNGDAGFTDLPGSSGSAGARARKDSPLPAALGSLDELNAAIGQCLAEADRINHVFVRETLGPIQAELLAAGADLAAGAAGQLAPDSADRIQRETDSIRTDLPRLNHFIIPGGSELAGRLHAARAVARRAERDAITALDPKPGADAPPALRYLNRLSNLLFALARVANRDAGEDDKLWRP